MDLRHLQTFITLSEIRNFTKTAEYLNYAQSNITAQIQQLEKELKVRLFERIGKSVHLTAAGLELYPYAVQMLNLSKEIERKFSGNPAGRITVGASESICIYRLPAAIQSFQSTHPGAELYLRVLDIPDFAPLLADHTIDIAFVLGPPAGAKNIITALRLDEEIRAFSAPGHPLAGKKTVSIGDFADQRLILTGKDCCYRKMFESELKKAGVKPNIVLETSSLQVIKQTVMSGLGICIVPRITVQKELENNELAEIHYEMNYGISSQLIYHKDKWMSEALRDFIQTVKVRSGGTAANGA